MTYHVTRMSECMEIGQDVTMDLRLNDFGVGVRGKK